MTTVMDGRALTEQYVPGGRANGERYRLATAIGGAGDCPDGAA
jgi:hypothetical protein